MKVQIAQPGGNRAIWARYRTVPNWGRACKGLTADPRSFSKHFSILIICPGVDAELRTCLQIAEQPVKGYSISGMPVPVAEIADMPRSANIGRPWLRRFHHGFIEANGEEYQAVFTVFPFARGVHFTLHPSALHGGLGQNDHNLVVDPNRLFNAFLEAVPTFQVFCRKPAPYPSYL